MEKYQSFLTSSVMDYVGSKEKNLQFLKKQLDLLLFNDKELQEKEDKTFFDLFSGTGLVSRLAFIHGFKVFTNDLEIFAKISSEVPVRYSLEDVNEIFMEIGKKMGLELPTYLGVVEHLNSLTKPRYPKNNYFSSYFAPKDTWHTKDKERLYYSAENAQKIDAIIEVIFNNRLFTKDGREIILASLVPAILEVVNNEQKLTRSYQPKLGKGKKEVKERVLSPLKLDPISFLSVLDLYQINPRFAEAENRAESNKFYAETVLSVKYPDQFFDIVYLDPPYNQQQYSVNYAHLISACENDKQEIGQDAKKFESRNDLSQSDFSRKQKDRRTGEKLAALSLKQTFDSIKAKYILYSYLPNSLLTIPEIVNIFSNEGENYIRVEYEMRYKNDDLLERNDQTNQIEHCLFIIEKGKKQYPYEIQDLIRGLKAKSIIATNETFDVNGVLIDLPSLMEQNPEWHYETDTIARLYKIYKGERYMFDVTFDYLGVGNIDTEFSEEEQSLITQYITDSKDKIKSLENDISDFFTGLGRAVEKNNQVEQKEDMDVDPLDKFFKTGQPAVKNEESETHTNDPSLDDLLGSTMNKLNKEQLGELKNGLQDLLNAMTSK